MKKILNIALAQAVDLKTLWTKILYILRPSFTVNS